MSKESIDDIVSRRTDLSQIFLQKYNQSPQLTRFLLSLNDKQVDLLNKMIVEYSSKETSEQK
ncbi:MAG: hypothetical protein WA364_19440 [Candidatus Nitrosopolaris sp.]